MSISYEQTLLPPKLITWLDLKIFIQNYLWIKNLYGFFLTSILGLILYRSLKKFQNNLLYTAISDIKASSIEIRKEKEC